METIVESDPKAVAEASEVLRAGGAILYPTDTVYGLGVDATNIEAIRKIYEIKARSAGNPISVVVQDLDSAEPYVLVTDAAQKLAGAFWPGALTIVLRRKEIVPPELTGGRETLGIRVPNHSFCRALAAEFGQPFTTTSANKAGTGDCRSLEEAKASLGEHFDRIDLAVDGGLLSTTKPSTIVDASGMTLHIFREGAIPAARIRDVLRD